MRGDGISARKCRLGLQMGCGERALLELVSIRSDEIEFVVLNPESERPDPYLRTRLTFQDHRRVEVAFRSLLEQVQPNRAQEERLDDLPELQNLDVRGKEWKGMPSLS